jgi:hypothetical protein
MMAERGTSRPSSVSERNTSTGGHRAVRASAGISSNDPYAQRPVYRPNQMPTSVCQTIATGREQQQPVQVDLGDVPVMPQQGGDEQRRGHAAASAAARAAALWTVPGKGGGSACGPDAIAGRPRRHPALLDVPP